MATREEVLRIGDRDVTITNPDKIFFPATGYTKLDLVRYYHRRGRRRARRWCATGRWR